MRSGLASLGILLSSLIVAAAASCGGDETGGGGSGNATATGTQTGSTSDGGNASGGSGTGNTGTGNTGTGNTGNTGTGGSGEGGSCTPTNPTADSLGGDCDCSGSCDNMGVPLPNGGDGTITGCGDVPTGVTGAALVCFRSYDGIWATHTYFANGYCALQASSCEGATTICNSAEWGDYAAMTSCPAGSVMITATTEVEAMSMQATVQTKTCVRSCACGEDCRQSETDPELDNEATQYDCIDKDGVKFCYDPRNLAEDYTATAF